MKQSTSWEAKSSSAKQEIPRILWNMKIHHRNDKESATCPCPEPAESRPNPLPNRLMSFLVVLTDGKNIMNDVLI